MAGHASCIDVVLQADGRCDRDRQRPRHPGRPAPEIPRQIGARSHHDHAAFRRQVQLATSTRPAAACMASASRSSTRCRSMLEVEVARGGGFTGRPSPAARRRAGLRTSAPSATGAAPPSVSGPTRRFSGSARTSGRAASSRWPAPRPICSAGWKSAGPARRSCWRQHDVPEKAVFHFPGGLKDFLAARIEGRRQSRQRPVRRPGSEARRAWQRRVGHRLARGRGRLHPVLLQHHPDARWRHTRARPARGAAQIAAHLWRADEQQARGADSPPTIFSSSSAVMLSVFISEPEFQGQTKDKLSSAEAPASSRTR